MLNYLTDAVSTLLGVNIYWVPKGVAHARTNFEDITVEQRGQYVVFTSSVTGQSYYCKRTNLLRTTSKLPCDVVMLGGEDTTTTDNSGGDNNNKATSGLKCIRYRVSKFERALNAIF